MRRPHLADDRQGAFGLPQAIFWLEWHRAGQARHWAGGRKYHARASREARACRSVFLGERGLDFGEGLGHFEGLHRQAELAADLRGGKNAADACPSGGLVR